MIRARFAVTGPEHLAIIHLITNSSMYQSIEVIKSDVRPFDQELNLDPVKVQISNHSSTRSCVNATSTH